MPTVPRHSGYLLVFAALLVNVFPVAAAAAPSGPTTGAGQALTVTGGGGSNGTGGGGLTAMPDLFTGGMSHEVPIDLPPGRGGLAPPVSLRYRSGGGNGFLGIGWELELGAVERSLKGGVDFAGDSFVLKAGGGASTLFPSAAASIEPR